MQMPKGRVVHTVKELREYLNDCEESWTDMDIEYLGSFEDQSIWIPYFDEHDNFLGYAEPCIDYPAHASVFILDKPKEI